MSSIRKEDDGLTIQRKVRRSCNKPVLGGEGAGTRREGAGLPESGLHGACQKNSTSDRIIEVRLRCEAIHMVCLVFPAQLTVRVDARTTCKEAYSIFEIVDERPLRC